MGLLITFLLAFLFLLAVLALVAWKVFATKDASGNRTTPGCLAAGGAGLALGCLGVLGFAAFIAGVVAVSSARSMETFVRTKDGLKVGLVRDAQARIGHDERRTLHVLLEWKGATAPDAPIFRELSERCREFDASVTPRTEKNEAGEDVTVVDIAVPLQASEIDELERALRRQLRKALPDLSLTQGVQVELRGDARERDEPHATEPEAGELR